MSSLFLRASFGLICGIAGMFSLTLNTSAQANDFFLSNIVSSSPEITRIQSIQVRDFPLKNTTEQVRLSQTKYFVSQVKQEVIRRVKSGELNSYEARDIVRELENLTFSMNEYFRNVAAAERSKQKAYRELAASNLANAKSSYMKLSAVTWQSVRN